MKYVASKSRLLAEIFEAIELTPLLTAVHLIFFQILKQYNHRKETGTLY